MSWTIDEALEYVRSIQDVAMERGFCILLGGGVLHRGHGPDLDLLAYPRTATDTPERLLAFLPVGRWETVEGVSEVYGYSVEGKKVEMIFQTRSCWGVPLRSPRGHPLFGEARTDVPVLTVEDYDKWYELYVLHPDGRIEALDFHELDDGEGSPFASHVPNPQKMQALVDRRDWNVDEKALEKVAGRWFLEVLS